jgi:hypothetical protein
MTVESSPAETTSDVVEQPGVNAGEPEVARTDVQTEASSTSEDSGAKTPATPLDAVKAALKTDTSAAESPPAKNGDGQAKAEAKPGDKPVEAAEDTDKNLPFHNHPRWKEVTSAKKALEGQLAELSPKAKRMDVLDGMFRETGLSPDDVGPLFDGGALLKRAGVTGMEVADLMKVGAALKLGDRELAKQIAGPRFEALGLQIVETLPPEIQKMVDEGAVSAEAAHRLASTEFRAQTERAKRERLETTIETQTESDRAAAFQGRVVQTAAAWEDRMSKSDADWSRKAPHVAEAIRVAVQRRPPTSEREVTEICDAALTQVNRILDMAAPRKPAVTPAVGGSSTTVRPVPKSPLEAVRLGLSA